jgi:hypothetical protein
MSKLTIAGIVAWLFGGVILLFQAISSWIGKGDVMDWKSLTLLEFVGKNNFDWIEAISWVTIQQAITYIVNLPLYVLLFCVGIIFFIANAFKPKL